MNTPHPHAQLSAYLDGALDEAQRRAVEAHLGSCADCRARLGELRATASLIRGLPDLAPSRRLVPRVGAPPMWLAPLRTLSTLASGLSVFLFLATALLANVSQLATTSSPAAAPALAPAGGAGAASASTAGPSAAFGAAEAARSAASGTPPPQAVSGASAPQASGAVRAPVPVTASPKLSVTDTLQKQTAGATPSAAEFNAASPSSAAAADAARDQHYSERSGPSLGSPWLWLGLAVVTGAVAIALQRRLRSV